MSKRERSAPILHDDGFTINGCVFHVDPKYKPIDAIGQGSYGVVCSVRNTDTNEKLAIKKITPMAGDEWDATHTLREIRLMRCLGAHENIISLKDLSMREDKDELYMMMELADTDLHRLIQSQCPLTEGHIRVIMFQILSGVKAMHDNGVLHRDLKPGNLLLNKDCELKITDFGLARMIPKNYQANNTDDASLSSHSDSHTSKSVVSPMTEYVVTRWYRPPELMLAPNGCYDGAVDMWSVGCILGELINRKPMFPGTDFMDQLTRVFKVVSIPEKEHRGYTIEKDALKFLQSLPPTPENAMEKLFKTGPPLALDLLHQLLCFNPKERISVDAALAHPFFDGVKDEWGEITPLNLGHSLEFAFETQSLPLSTLRSYICEEVRAFRVKEEAEKKSKLPQQSDENAPVNNKADTGAIKQSQQNLRVANDMPAGRGFTIKGCDFNVPPQYKPLQVLGEGSYGIVCAATDTTTTAKGTKQPLNVAIKKITPMAGDEWDAKHTLREIRLMRYFGHHPNIASLQNLSTCTEKDELYLMMDLVDTDLHRLIQSKTKLEEAHIAAIMYQLLCGAKVLHENGVLHRDLKPGNLLVSKNCDVKITDFGLSRYIPHGGRGNNGTSGSGKGHEKGKDLMTEYVVTRWYRAPEIMLAPNGTYGEAVDMWSIGCIFGELLNRKPMFPGSDFIDQLTRVFSVLPVPPSDKRGYVVEGDAQKFLDSLPACSPEAITKLFRKASPEAVSLLRRLLCVNPERRINAKQALAHPYFKTIRQQLGEPPELTVPKTFDFEFDYHDFPLSHLRQLIQDEVKLLQQDRTLAAEKEVVEAVAAPKPLAEAVEKKEPAMTEKTMGKEQHKQQIDDSESEEVEDDDEEVTEKMAKKTVSTAVSSKTVNISNKEREQKPESDDDVTSEASSGRNQQKNIPSSSSTIQSSAQQKKASDPEVDDEDDDGDQERESIQVERERRPVSRIERPRSATGSAASAAAVRRAAVTARYDTRDEDHLHRGTTARSTAGNNEATERWGHTRPAVPPPTAIPRAHTSSNGATAILGKKPATLNPSAAAASRLLSARAPSSTAVSSNQEKSSSLLATDEKSDAYRHPEKAAGRTGTSTTSSSRTLATSASTKEILPDGWIKRIHSKSGREYYYDTVNKVSTWKLPAAAIKPMDNLFVNNNNHSHHDNNNHHTTSTSTRSATTISRRTVSSASTSGLTKESTISTSSSSLLGSGSGPSSGGSAGKESMLPKDWERRTDPKTGRLFYVNLVTKRAFARLPSAVSASILNLGRPSSGNSSADVAARKTAALAATMTIEQKMTRKVATVPHSPQFSQMSWQKKTRIDE